MSVASDERAGARWLFVLFVAAWLTNVVFSLVGSTHTLLGPYQFREAQTAISTYFFPPTGFRFDYETPLFGPPWSAPLEFPAFEATVAWFVHATGMNLDVAGRLISWLYFQMALPGVFLVLGSLGMARRFRWLVLTLLVTSPIYLFFSRCFLIESEALCAGVWFIAGLIRFVDGGRWRWLVVASLAGALGAASKITTIVVFGVFGLIYAFEASRRRRVAGAGGGLGLIASRMAAAHVLPVIGGIWWLLYSHHVRAQNPNTEFLNTHFGFWSFGDVAQRLSWDYWRKTTLVWRNGIATDAGVMVAVLGFAHAARAQRRVIVALVLTFLSGQLIFSNLYYVHDYYFYACGLFLVMAVGMALAGLFTVPSYPRWLPWTVAVLLPLLQIAVYSDTYLRRQTEKFEPTEVMRMLTHITAPEDMIAVAGVDWDAAIPYYAHRRSHMLRAGAERDVAAVKASFDRLDPRTFGALVIFGRMDLDADWRKITEHLDLEPTPVLMSTKLRVGVWVPRDRAAAVRAKIPAEGYVTLAPTAARPTADGQVVLGAREIAQRPEFALFSPRPVSARVRAGIALMQAGDMEALNAHVPSQLSFRINAGQHTLTMLYGLADGAYAGSGQSDGVEFQVVLPGPGGAERVLFSRMLNPRASTADQGTQRSEIVLPPETAGNEVIVRTLPGPAGNAAYDWSYLGPITVR